MEPPADALHTFRRSFYECFHRRSDALFELADAILTADGAAPSPAHLSLQGSHRRGWGSLYAALWRGRIDDEALRKLLARHPLVFYFIIAYAFSWLAWMPLVLPFSSPLLARWAFVVGTFGPFLSAFVMNRRSS
jgi:hypothetical protein